MANLIASIIFYNDTPELLEKSLKAIKASNIDIIAIDGAFREFPKSDKERYYSTDGCIDIAKKYADLYIPAPKWEWVDQAHKRSTYFQLIPDGDFCIVLDGDEFLHPCEIDPNQWTENIYMCQLHRSADDGWSNSVRIYRIFPDLKYMGQHSRIYRIFNHNPKETVSGSVVQSHGNNVPLAHDKSGRPITFTHSPELRPAPRQKQDDIYMSNRKEKDFLNKIHQERMGK